MTIEELQKEIIELKRCKGFLKDNLQEANRIHRIEFYYGKTKEYTGDHSGLVGDNHFAVCLYDKDSAYAKPYNSWGYKEIKELYIELLKKELRRTEEKLAAYEAMLEKVNELLGGWTYDTIC